MGKKNNFKNNFPHSFLQASLSDFHFSDEQTSQQIFVANGE